MVALPPSVVTRIPPERLFAPIVAVMVVGLTMVNEAGAPPIFTLVAVDRLLPVIVITPPTPVIFGLKSVIVGVGTNVKPARFPVPPLLVTLTLPDAPPLTMAVILVQDTTLNEEALTPPNITKP